MGAVINRRAPSLRMLIDFAHVLAEASGKVVLRHFRRSIPVDNKAGGGTFDPVTAADRAAERVMGRLIAERWPEHGVLGEEYGARAPDARFRWVLDPIDGTRAFLTGQTAWGTLIGLLEGSSPILGLVNQPFTRERFWSGERAAYMRVGEAPAKRLATRPCPRLADAVLTTTDPDLFEDRAERAGFARLKSRVRMTRYGGDCYAYCLLAAGFIDLVVEAGLKAHDVVALVPIIERAGGRITSWDGGSAVAGGRIVAAGDPALHEQALEVLAG